MIIDAEETLSRFELLSIVKKNSQLLKNPTTADDRDADDVELDARFWRDVLDLYFISGNEAKNWRDDDMLFFVRKKSLRGEDSNENAGDPPPYFVHRWAPKLDKLVAESLLEVDWRYSYYLNLIAHSSYGVTVAICSHQVLRDHRPGNDPHLSPIYKVVKTFYASPSRVNFHLDSKKEVEMEPAYPDICFAVDDFDSTFGAVGVAFPDSTKPQEQISCNDNPSGIKRDSGRAKIPKVWAIYIYVYSRTLSNSQFHMGDTDGKKAVKRLTLFSGFVTYQMVRGAYDAGKSPFGNLLSLGHSPGKTDRIYMKGPGGCGEVEVAVSGIIGNYDNGKTNRSKPVGYRPLFTSFVKEKI